MGAPSDCPDSAYRFRKGCQFWIAHMTTDDRLFSLIRRISAIESQLVTRRSFLDSTDAVGARYYREL